MLYNISCITDLLYLKKKKKNNYCAFPAFSAIDFEFTCTVGIPGRVYGLRDHHRGLNIFPVSIDRKCWNGMLCLSAF